MDDFQNFIIKLDSQPEGKNWLSGKIVDDNDHLIGNVKAIGGFRMQISWVKADGSLLVSAHKHAISMRDIYDIKDPSGKVLGIAKGKGLFSKQMVLKNPVGKEILTSKKVGKPPPSLEFRDEEGKVIATFEIKQEKIKSKNWKERLLGGNVHTSCIFSIKDLSFDKLFLHGFFIAILGDHFFQFQVGGMPVVGP